MKLCHESDGAASDANARATAASSDELCDWGGGSMHTDGVCCAAISAAAARERVLTARQQTETAIGFIVIDQNLISKLLGLRRNHGGNRASL